MGTKKTAGKKSLPNKYIDCVERRKSCFRKRSLGLCKKMWELSVLTGARIKTEVYFPDTEKKYHFDSTLGPDLDALPPQMKRVIASTELSELPVVAAKQAAFSPPPPPSPCDSELGNLDVEQLLSLLSDLSDREQSFDPSPVSPASSPPCEEPFDPSSLSLSPPAIEEPFYPEYPSSLSPSPPSSEEYPSPLSSSSSSSDLTDIESEPIQVCGDGFGQVLENIDVCPEMEQAPLELNDELQSALQAFANDVFPMLEGYNQGEKFAINHDDML